MTTITALPTAPSRANPANFATLADAWVAALATFTTETNTVAGEVNTNATTASTAATTATTQAGIATTQASNAAASAASALNAPGTNATSTTSLTIATGAQSLTIQTGKAYSFGQPLVIAYTTTPSIQMSGTVTSYNSGTGALVMNITSISGSGTYATWGVSMGIVVNPAGLERVARTSNIALVAADFGKIFDITSGTFTQTTDTAANLGNKWWVYLTNTGTGVVTYGSYALTAGSMLLLQSDGSNIRPYPVKIAEPLMIVREEQTSNTGGGTPGSTATWLTRVLNTTNYNGISGASLSSNQISLPAGTYVIEGSAPAYKADGHKTRVYNVTGAATLVTGTSESNGSPETTQTRSWFRGLFTLSATSSIRIEHRVQTASANGFGRANNSGEVEVYTELTLRRIA